MQLESVSINVGIFNWMRLIFTEVGDLSRASNNTSY